MDERKDREEGKKYKRLAQEAFNESASGIRQSIASHSLPHTA